jgi:hypothetical protein
MQLKTGESFLERSNNCINGIIELINNEIKTYKNESENVQNSIPDIEKRIAGKVTENGLINPLSVLLDEILGVPNVDALISEVSEKYAALAELRKCIKEKEEEREWLESLKEADIEKEEVKLQRLQLLVKDLFKEVVIDYGVTSRSLADAEYIGITARSIGIKELDHINGLQLVNKIAAIATEQSPLLSDYGIFKGSEDLVPLILKLI